MNPAAALADVYSGGYAALRAQARRGDPAALTAAAKQFEAYFLEQMLKSMRAASPPDPLFGGSSADLYKDMFDHQLSLEMAKGRGIGFAALLVRQLRGAAAGDGDGDGPSGVARLGSRIRGPVTPPPAVRRFESPAEFVEALRPLAARAGDRLGVSPRLLLAQAALETGWGGNMLRYGDGRNANNLFGIKADRGWTGPVVNRPTLEFQGGIMARMSAPFRAYPSVAASFDDYVALIRGDTRYRPALAAAADPAAYMRALARAGYATDPDYATKVVALMHRPELAPRAVARPGL